MKYLAILLFFFTAVHAQEGKHKDESEENEDFEYELRHKNKSWFKDMSDGANYFEIKAKFEKYFARHEWEESKARSIGENWLKSKLFYLDSNGNVQAEPAINSLLTKNILNTTSTTISGTWKLLGPSNSATTGYSGKGNHGGYVYLSRIDPTNNQKMFISFVTGGLWMTADGGTNWTLTDTGYADTAYNDIDVCIGNPQVVYALSDKQLLKSTDGGLNWQPTTLNNTNYSGRAYDIAVSPTNANVVVARWGTSIYRTSDGGVSWNQIVTSLPNYGVWDCSIHSEMLDWSTTDNNTVYFLSTSNNNQLKVYYSNTSGASFTLINTITLDSGANGQIIGWAKLHLPTSNPNSIYISIGTGSSAYAHQAVQLYKLNAVTGAQELSRINMVAGTGDPYNHDPVLHHGDIAMDRNDENKIAYGSYGNSKIHYSTNNGQTFVTASSSTHSDLRTLDFVSNRILIGSDGECVLTTDGGATNTTISNSISNHELWGFGSAFKTDIVASGNNHGPVMIKENANGFDWYNGSGADQGNTDVNPLDDRYVYSQGYSNYRYFRTGPHTLVNQPNFLDLGGIYSYFNSIEFHPNKYYSIITHHAGQYPTGNANLATWKNSLIKTEDNGNSISIVKTFTNQVFREKISMKNPNYMYVVEGLSNNKLWKTTDSGATWTNITPSLGASANQTNISDIAVGDENPNEIWVTYSGVQTACKILKSNDYGVTWINLTQPVLTSSPLTKIIFQRGSNGGVYVGNKSGVYYKNNTMPNWVLLGTGLPQCEVRFMFINYNQGKLKIGTSRGAFEHNLYETSPPNALISVASANVLCPQTETVQFKDYSVVRNASAIWNWSFPGGNPTTSNLENPIVSYAGAPNGVYDVTLTVTDAYGTSTQTLTNFIEVNNQCGTLQADTVPGNVAKLNGSAANSYLEVKDLNLNKNSFTFSCWVKPNGIQTDYSAVFMSQNDANTFGLNFKNGNNTLGFHPNWGWNSGLIVPQNQWSHVALVSNGTTVTIYLNGVASTNNYAIPSELFSTINLGSYNRGRSDRFTNLEMDEVCIWNRALSTDEIRKWRHLTKSDAGNSILNGLVAYYQFNETLGNISLNKAQNASHLTHIGSGITHDFSNVPVFGGVSEKLNITSSGIKNFSTVGLSMNFSSGTYPNGDVWVSTGSINPDTLPDTNTNFNAYTIVNNYGTNQTFTPLQSIAFTSNNAYNGTLTPNSYRLYKRNSNDFGNTWGSYLDTADTVSGSGINTSITFNNGLNLSSFSQFMLTNNTTLSENEFEVSLPALYPNPLRVGNPLKINIPIDWGKCNMVIYNALGKLLAYQPLNSETNETLLNVPSGVYFVTIFNFNKRHTKKLIIK